MSTWTRTLPVSAAAVLALVLAGCDDTETAEGPEAPAETTAPVEEGATTEPTGTGDDATTGTEDMVPEADPEADAGY
ncbi:hypothetical protein ACH9EU_07175 [Kocuria sp. M1R5S2]|uniref:hypothetical protein n=1 Tax=Kocuria rhizosphaerae TaxID=3376285 RepID=UPI0037B5F1E2